MTAWKKAPPTFPPFLLSLMMLPPSFPLHLFYPNQPVLWLHLCWLPSIPLLLASPSNPDLSWIFRSPALPWQEDPLPLLPAFEPITPHQLVYLLVPPWLLPPLVPFGTIVLKAPTGSLVPLASPWLDVALPAPQTSGPSTVLRPSTPPASPGFTFPSAPSWSSVPSSASFLWHPGIMSNTFLHM